MVGPVQILLLFVFCILNRVLCNSSMCSEVHTIVPLEKPHLFPEAIPTIFEGLPSYLSPRTHLTRKDPDTRAEEIKHREESTHRAKMVREFIKELKANEIVTFEDLKTNLIVKLNLLTWEHSVCENMVYLFKLNKQQNGSININTSITIDSDLTLKLFYKNKLMKYDYVRDIIPKTFKISQWSQMQKILNEFEDDVCFEQETIKTYLERALENLLAIDEIIEGEPEFEYKNVVDVIADQIVQMLQHGKRRKYSNNTILIAYMIYLQSSKSYEIIRNKNILILPHRSTLTKIAASQDVGADNFESNNNYLKKIIANISPIDKLVVLEIDEIYLDCRLTYKAKSLKGVADNKDAMAKTLNAFLANSCYGNGLKDIVRLIPTTNPTGNDLQRYTTNVIDQLQALTLRVIAVVTIELGGEEGR